MHDAYEASPILEKLPLKIESIACYGKWVGYIFNDWRLDW